MSYEWVYSSWSCTRNKVMINRGQFLILAKLMTSKERGYPWVDLKGERQRNLKNMQLSDWIVQSNGKDGVKYSITGRGETVLKAFAVKKHRTDKMCARCGNAPKQETRGYCRACAAVLSKERYHRYLNSGRERLPDGTCKYCHKPRHRSSTGRIHYALCDDHLKDYLRDKSMAYRRRRYEKGSENRRCFCGKPVHVTNKDVHHLCTEHYKARLACRTIQYKTRRFSKIMQPTAQVTQVGVDNRYSTK